MLDVFLFVGAFAVFFAAIVFFNLKPMSFLGKIKGCHFLYALTAFYWAQMFFAIGPFLIPYNDEALKAEALGIILIHLSALVGKGE